jgi:plasmid maintenance system antidote protein VapI
MAAKKLTPWQRVHQKFGGSQSDFARKIGVHRSKISRALKDELGLIGGTDQMRLKKAAARFSVDLSPADLTP